MQIGSVKLDNITILAPLAGITNLAFRILAKNQGCALVCSEMVSSNGLVHGSKKTELLLKSLPQERPLSVQIFGADPFIMADAAKMVELSGADIIDINLGCSVKKVLKTGAGSALMKEPEKAEKIFKYVRKAVNTPLTIKVRTGWDKSGNDAYQIADIAQEYGIDAIAIHPRTAGQGFTGQADWSVIREMKKKVSIPVIGNGDITVSEDAVRMLEETGCDAVMIGRASIGNPWIFSQVLDRIKGNDISSVSLLDRYNVMVEYLESSIKFFGEKAACFMMRSKLGWFAKGLPDSSRFRDSLKHTSSEDEAKNIIKKYFDSLKE